MCVCARLCISYFPSPLTPSDPPPLPRKPLQVLKKSQQQQQLRSRLSLTTTGAAHTGAVGTVVDNLHVPPHPEQRLPTHSPGSAATAASGATSSVVVGVESAASTTTTSSLPPSQSIKTGHDVVPNNTGTHSAAQLAAEGAPFRGGAFAMLNSVAHRCVCVPPS